MPKLKETQYKTSAAKNAGNEEEKGSDCPNMKNSENRHRYRVDALSFDERPSVSGQRLFFDEGTRPPQTCCNVGDCQLREIRGRHAAGPCRRIHLPSSLDFEATKLQT